MDKARKRLAVNGVTRRSKSWVPNKGKNQVDNALAKGVRYQGGVEGAGDKANQEGIKIDDDVWSEFITVGKFLCLIKDDPDIYDLFDWIRININSGQEYGNGLLARVDAEISKEDGPWVTN